MPTANDTIRDCGVVSGYDKTVFFHFFIAERSAWPNSNHERRVVSHAESLIDVEDEDDGIRTTGKTQK